MEIVFSTAHLDHHALNLSALYCESVILPDDLVAVATPLEETIVYNSDSSYTGTAIIHSVYRTIPNTMEEVFSTYFEEGILRRSESGHVDDVRDFESQVCDFLNSVRDNKLYYDYFRYNDSLIDSKKPSLVTQISLLMSSAILTSTRYNLPLLTDNLILDGVIRDFWIASQSMDQINKAKFRSSVLAGNALSEFLPDISDVHPDKILEVRHRFSSELDAFRANMRSLSGKIKADPWDQQMKSEIDWIVETEIRPEVENLRNSLRRSNLKLVKDVFINLKDVKTYIPFIGSVLGHVDIVFAASASLGIAGFQAIYDSYLEKKRNVDENGLLFLLKSRNIFR